MRGYECVVTEQTQNGEPIKAIGRYWRWTLLLLMGLHGCGGVYSIVEFEILEPATVNLPQEVEQLMVLNRAPITLDAFEKEDRRNLDRKTLITVDTLITNSISRGLLSVLQQSPIRQFHYPVWASSRRTDTALIGDLILTRREVDAYCEEYGADAILSLELYSMDLDEIVDYFSDGPVMTRYFEVSTRTRWIVHVSGYPAPFDIYELSDTLYFSEVEEGVPVRFYSAAEMIRTAFSEAGKKYGRYLVPIWVDTRRAVFRGRGDSLRIAAKQTDEGNWDSAYSIWSRMAESPDSTLVSKAFHNMAVYFELEDNLDSAASLARTAAAYDTLSVVNDYLEELEIRILNRNEVLDQIR